MSSSVNYDVANKRQATSVRIIYLLAPLTVFAPFSIDMYLSSFQNIANDFHTTLGEVQLSLSFFFLGLTIGQLFYGPLSDIFGRKKPLLFGVMLFSISSLLLIFSPNIESFIGLRFVQAMGGCAGMVLSRAIIQDRFIGNEAAKALSLMMVIQAIGPITGPVLGAYISANANWQAIFAFLTFFGVICLVAGFFVLPETLPKTQRLQVSEHNRLRQILRSFASLLCNKAFMVPTLASALALSLIFSFISGSSFVFMNLHGLTQQQYGWLFGINAIGMIIASQTNRILLERFSPQSIFSRVLLVNILVSFSLMMVADSESLIVLMIPVFLCVASVPLLAANGMAIAMSVCKTNKGTASSIIGVLQFALASVVSALVALLHDGSAYPMVSLMFAASVLAALVFFIGNGAVLRKNSQVTNPSC